ncbi:MAG: high affinity Mn2+ porin [Bacteroidetes bacterium]|nr:high affinity Mn2+ porin [Bacteroidota bacterium]
MIFKKTTALVLIQIVLLGSIYSQILATDTLRQQRWNIHFQSTVIGQWHPAFHSPYVGQNSMVPREGAKVSITTTIFAGVRLWKGAEVYFNPEISGGEGLSQALGAAGALNGETFRVGSATPKVYVARFFFRQYIALSKDYEWVENDANQLHVKRPVSYLSFLVGRINTADYFDNSSVAHDARKQFMNWGLMAAGAWDYPANTRGYTYGFVAEYVYKKWGVRYGLATLPTSANGSQMNFDLSKAAGHMLEAEGGWTVKGLEGKLRLLGFANYANMGNYRIAIAQQDTPNIKLSEKYSRTKFGFGINAEQQVTPEATVFARYSWNDGQNETWVFTEIDRSFSAGAFTSGKYWKRPLDNMGLAVLVNGLSNAHRDYLAKGGYGFIIGDGKLNYAPEFVVEWYYSFAVYKDYIFISPDYQFVLNPAYNKDRGPVNAFGVRVHAEF